MKRVVELVLYPVLALAALIVFLYPAFAGPVAFRLPLILLGLTGIVACCYLFHWCRHPGIYQTKTLSRWLGHIGVATALLVLTPLLAGLHLSGITHLLAPGIKLSKLLGLDFRFEPGDRVRIRTDARTSLHPGAQGSARSVRIVRRGDLGTNHAEEGTILYLVQLEDGECVEIPEQFLTEAR
jgi:hypothetical protein